MQHLHISVTASYSVTDYLTDHSQWAAEVKTDKRMNRAEQQWEIKRRKTERKQQWEIEREDSADNLQTEMREDKESETDKNSVWKFSILFFFSSSVMFMWFICESAESSVLNISEMSAFFSFSSLLWAELFSDISSEEENSESEDKKSLSSFLFLSLFMSDETLRMSEFSASLLL